MDGFDSWDDVEGIIARARQLRFTTGSSEENIKQEANLAQLLLLKYERQKKPIDLYDAIRHTESILGRLGPASPPAKRAEYLDKLCYMEMSAYHITGSMQRINKSIDRGKEAVAVAESTGYPKLYEIYNNLGYGLSHRATLGGAQGRPTDLDEAIECGRKVLRLAPRDSDAYLSTAANLSTRLSTRYKRDHKAEDNREAMSLVAAQLKRYAPGTQEHSFALTARGTIAYDLFQHTADVEDLEDALKYITIGLRSLPKGHETNAPLMYVLSTLYGAKFDKTGNLEHLRQSVGMLKEAIEVTPSDHQVRIDYISYQLSTLRDVVDAETLPKVENTLQYARELHEQVPSIHEKRNASNISLALVLCKRYILSRQLPHWVAFVDHLMIVFKDFKNGERRSGRAVKPLAEEVLHELKGFLCAIDDAPGSAVKSTALATLYDDFVPVYKSGNLLRHTVNTYIEHRDKYADIVRKLQATTGRPIPRQTLPDRGKSRDILDQVVVPGHKQKTLGDVFSGLLTGSPDADVDLTPGVRKLPSDNLSQKLPQDLAADLLPKYEGYIGPGPWAWFLESTKQIEAELFKMDQHRGKQLSSSLCSVCRRTGLIVGNNFTSRAQLKWRPFGTWAQLIGRASFGCIVCQLIVQMLSDGTHERLRLHPRFKNLDRDVQGTQIYPESLPSGENYIAVEYGYRRPGAIRIVRQDNFRQILRQAYEASSSTLSDLLDNTKSPVYAQSGQEVSIGLIKSWLETCEHHHLESCSGVDMGEQTAAIDILLVDVFERKLVRGSSSLRYLALSYVWGKTPMSKTTTTNLKNRFEKESLPRDLPATIEDSILLLNKLGERYLWVDTLCIVHDDATNKHQSISQMGIIYSRAFATIVGIHGSNADAGLPGVRPGTRMPQKIAATWSPKPQIEVDGDFIHHFNTIRQTDRAKHEALVCCRTVGVPLVEITGFYNEIVDATDGKRWFGDDPSTSSTPLPQRLAMVTHPPPLQYKLLSSQWDTRGWTFQERLLSTRCIYFASDYVYFQCGKDTLCETGGDLLPWPDVTPEPTYEPEVVPRIKRVETNALTRLKNIQVTEFNSSQTNPTVRVHLEAYKELVEKYSRRQFSYSSDILHAAAGYLATMDASFGSRNIFGLPGNYLDLALLWNPAEPTSRRKIESATQPGGREAPVFPSWSWAGWNGSVRHSLIEHGLSSHEQHDHTYSQSTIGCFQLVHGGKLCQLSKSDEDMRRTIVKDHGVGQPILKTYPRYIQYSRKDVENFHSPDLGPGILQFSTYTIRRDRLSVNVKGDCYLGDAEHGLIPGKQKVAKILDVQDQHVGLGFFSASDVASLTEGGSREWALISTFGDADERRLPFTTTDPMLRLFDESVFSWKGDGSGLVNVILIAWDYEVAERIGVAQIHRSAWEAAQPKRKHVRLQ